MENIRKITKVAKTIHKVGEIGERLKDIEVTCEKFIEDEQTHYGYNRVETTTTLRLKQGNRYSLNIQARSMF